jgi:hypothetical protein
VLNSNIAKACMPYWYEWSNGWVEEVKIRICVNDDGKPTLDGSFERWGCNFCKALKNRVTNIINAETVLGACWGTEELGWNEGSQKKLRDVR